MAQNDFEEKLNEAADAAKEAVNDVVTEGREVAQEAASAVTGQPIDPQAPGNAGYRAPEPQGGNNGYAIAGLVLGIISILAVFVNTWVALICGIIGVVLGAKARKECQTSLATAGFVCSIIGLVLAALSLVCALACIGTLGAMAAL